MVSKSVYGNVSLEEHKDIIKLVEEGKYINISDFIRVAVRKSIGEEVGTVLLKKGDLKILKIIQEEIMKGPVISEDWWIKFVAKHVRNSLLKAK